MATFAKLDSNNKVIQVVSLHNNELMIDGVENEQKGIDFLNNLFKTNDVWKQTSYNTAKGVHTLGGTPFRKNHAGLGNTYDESRDAFISPQPFPSWILNEDTCRWDPPSARPDDGKLYGWDEETTSWREVIDSPDEEG